MATEILSWNILSGGFKDYNDTAERPQRIDGIAAGVKESGPDIVALIDTYRWNDVFKPAELKEMFGYPYVYTVTLEDERLQSKGHDNGITVFSRVPDTEMQTVRLSTRNAVHLQTGELDIVAAYLDDEREDVRLEQTDAVLAMINPDKPTIITGDMNTIHPYDLEQSNQGLRDLGERFPGPLKSMEATLNGMRRGEVPLRFEDAGFVDLGKGKGNTIPANLFPLPNEVPILRLDYAFGNCHIRSEAFRVLTEGRYPDLSDHYPIWMRVSNNKH